jgi:DNA (cytosine-5)-methyltransferase 1
MVEINYSHSGDKRAKSTSGPAMTQTGQQSMGVAFPPSFIAELHGNSRAGGMTDPLMCVVASGGHHALLSSDAFLTYYYGKSHKPGAMTEPINTMTGNDRAGLVSNALQGMTVDDLAFRMLQAREIGKAMAFPGTYIVKGNQREQVKQYGNAVTPPTMKMIMERCVATLL